MNPAYDCLKPNAVGVRMQQQLKETGTGINLNNVLTHRLPVKPPWLLKTASFFPDLRKLGNKCDTLWYNYKSMLSEVLSMFNEYERIYIDDAQVTAAAVSGDKTVV